MFFDNSFRMNLSNIGVSFAFNKSRDFQNAAKGRKASATQQKINSHRYKIFQTIFSVWKLPHTQIQNFAEHIIQSIFSVLQCLVSFCKPLEN